MIPKTEFYHFLHSAACKSPRKPKHLSTGSIQTQTLFSFFFEFPHLIVVLLETNRLTITITRWTKFRGGGGLCVLGGGGASLGILNAQKSQWGRGSDIRVPLSLKSGPSGVINLQKNNFWPLLLLAAVNVIAVVVILVAAAAVVVVTFKIASLFLF